MSARRGAWAIRRRSVILAYHGVGDSDRHGDPHFLRVSPERFREQVGILAAAGFEFVTVAELVRRRSSGAASRGLVALSFDDGMEDNHSVLLPLLAEYGIPATVYVTTGLIGKPNPWVPGTRMMTADELRTVAAAGVEIGSHGVSHSDLSKLDRYACLREMTESREELEAIVGRPVTTFAYPFGAYGEEALLAARDSGFMAAVTCHDLRGRGLQALPRTMVTGRDNATVFALKLAGIYEPLFQSAPGVLVRRATRPLRTRATSRRERGAEPSPGERAGERALANTLLRACGEVVGKLASLALFAAVAHTAGETGLGTLVLAFALLQLAMVPADLGFDRYLVRAVALDRSRLHSMFPSIIGLKLALSLPVALVAFAAIHAIGYPQALQETVYALAPGILIDSLARTVFHAFTGLERGGPVAVSIVVQRLSAAALGLAALGYGFGLVAVAACYSVGAGLGLITGLALLRRRHVATLRPRCEEWPQLVRASLPFGAQDVATLMLFRLDAVLLSLLGSAAAVGIYGAAYRLFEATFFATFALIGAFSAMFAYLRVDGEPALGTVLARSLKLALVTLIPVAVGFAVLADPIVRLLFGEGLAAAAGPLRILAPAVALFGIVGLASSLAVSRGRAPAMVRAVALAVALNALLNVLLIPPLGAEGAAIAMLATEVALAGAAVRLALQLAPGARWHASAAGPVIAGGVMAAAMLPLIASPALSLAAGGLAYVASLTAVEHAFNPGDLRLLRRLVVRRLGGVPT